MKKIRVFLLLIVILSVLCSCGKIEESIEINCDDAFQIDTSKLKSEAGVVWESSDPELCEVVEGTIIGKIPGQADVVAKIDEKVVATYHVNIKLVPVSEIILSSDSIEITEGESATMKFTVLPLNASTYNCYGITFTSTDESIVTVSPEGELSAVAPGNASVVLSTDQGVSAVCQLTVNKKSAYSQLSAKEKEFVDCVMINIGDFYSPEAIKIVEIDEGAGGSTSFGSYDYKVKVNGIAQAGNKEIALCVLGNNGLIQVPEDHFSYNTLMDWFTPSSGYDLSLINDAIQEKLEEIM